MARGWNYVLDANTFVEPKKRYYAFDLCPSYWRNLIELHFQYEVCSIDRVKAEIDGAKDDLADWSNNGVPQTFFQPTDVPAVIDAYRNVISSVKGNTQYQERAKRDFASGADGWLIAYCTVNQCVLVTHEAYNTESKKRIPLPNVCVDFNVQWVNAFEMLRTLGVSLG